MIFAKSQAKNRDKTKIENEYMRLLFWKNAQTKIKNIARYVISFESSNANFAKKSIFERL